jgi:hypothetical protein
LNFDLATLQSATERQDGISAFQSQIRERESKSFLIQPGATPAAKKPLRRMRLKQS